MFGEDWLRLVLELVLVLVLEVNMVHDLWYMAAEIYI